MNNYVVTCIFYPPQSGHGCVICQELTVYLMQDHINIFFKNRMSKKIIKIYIIQVHD